MFDLPKYETQPATVTVLYDGTWSTRTAAYKNNVSVRLFGWHCKELQVVTLQWIARVDGEDMTSGTKVIKAESVADARRQAEGELNKLVLAHPGYLHEKQELAKETPY